MTEEQKRAIVLEKIMEQNQIVQTPRQDSEKKKESDGSASSYYDTEEDQNSVDNDPQRKNIDQPIILTDPSSEQAAEVQHQEYQRNENQLIDVQIQE